MSLVARLKKIGIDTYLLLLAGTVLLATVLPVSGDAAVLVKTISVWAVALLFFLYGARLNTAAVVAGIANWRLQGLVFLTTYLVFPVIGVVLALLLSPFLGPSITTGLLFLVVLPSTVNSSIAFTGMAHGNVPASVCAASVSNLVGVFLTPALAALLLHTKGGGVNVDAIGSIALQILLPFAVGQLLHRWLGGWIGRHKRVTLVVDRGSILLIVYSAFSAGMVAGVWQQLDLGTLALLFAADAGLLARDHGGRGADVAVCRFEACRPDDAAVLWLDQEPRERRADGQYPVRRHAGQPDHPADHAVPPDPAVRLRHHRATLGQPHRGRAGPRHPVETKRPAPWDRPSDDLGFGSPVSRTRSSLP